MRQSAFDRTFALLAIVAVGIALVAGFWALGTPFRQRQINADEQRIQNLRSIAWNLHKEAKQAQEQGEPVQLPESLEKSDRKIDPLTDEPYEYRRLSNTTYELCAEFATDSAADPLRRRTRSSNLNVWQHPQGRHCFQLDVLEEPTNSPPFPLPFSPP